MERLPRVLLYAVCECLLPADLNEGLSQASKELRAVVAAFFREIEDYSRRFLGPLPFFKSLSAAQVLPVLLEASAPSPGILALGATYTNGGVFINSIRFWAQNMFEYTGSVYTTNNLTENVTVSGAYIGQCQDRARFTSQVHEDLFGLLEQAASWNIPQRYKRNFVTSECFMKGKPGRRGVEYTPEEYAAWGKEEGPIFRTGAITRAAQNVFTDEVPRPAGFALATTVGVARPGFATCPVRTLLVCTQLQHRTPDLSLYYSLSSLDEVLGRSSTLPPICSQCTSGPFSYVEFVASEGPLLWLQFQSSELSQVEVAIHPRLFTQADVLLIDIDDRREEFGTEEKGIDVTYVLFGGREITAQIRALAELPKQADVGPVHEKSTLEEE